MPLCSRSTSLHLLERVSSDAVTTILHKLIEQRMEARCRGEYERSFLNDFQEGDATLKRWRCHMHSFFYLIYVSMRIEELFSIIRDFPDSKPAIEDLKYCLERTGQRQQLLTSLKAAMETRLLHPDFPDSKPAIEDLKYCLERTGQRQQLLTSLKAAMETRLLHPGVHTSDIITLYISAIMALRELDPSMVILQVACEPIRKNPDSSQVLVKNLPAAMQGSYSGVNAPGNTGGIESMLKDSTASPFIVLCSSPDKCGSKRRSSDIISLLVSIYGSKELFISEYRSVLADRLIHQLSYNTARSAHTQPKQLLQWMFWAYIQAMLTNLDSMSLERIHNMLKMFVTMGPVVTEMDIQELQAFLQTKVRDQQLISSGGVYRLPKSPN
ncbi:UNVERIFIED_CONTAM: hypothetical protein FKN15_008867 [Acipenser sinensis]